MRLDDDTTNATGAFALAIEASPGGIVVVSPDGRIVLVNRELERQFGYGREELVGRPVDMLVPEALRGSHAASREGFGQAPTTRPMGDGRELFGRRKDGTSIPIEIGLKPIDTADGVFVLAHVVDTTERRRLERLHTTAIEEQRSFEHLVVQFSRQFINLPPEGIDAAIQDALQRLCGTFGLDRGTLLRIAQDGTPFGPVGWAAPGVPSSELLERAPYPWPWAIARCLAGETVAFATVDQIPDEGDRAACRALGLRSAVWVPLSVDGRVVGALRFDMLTRERRWAPDDTERLSGIATVFGHALARRERDEALRQAMSEVEWLKDELEAENVKLRGDAQSWLSLTPIVGKSAAVHRVLAQIRQVSATDSTVLLLGETGTGKELFATQIHEWSPRRGRAMVRVNCAAIPSTLIESELFGREKGAFTDALARQVGRFELAHGSTIFLDEIGDLPPEVQVKLLRVLEEGQFERLGSPQPITVNTRIIAATHRNLEQRMAEGGFREDLYYRLNVFPIHVPPLRDRQEDIPLLVWRFVEEFSRAFGKRVETIAPSSLSALLQYPWPGNIRELRNVVERSMITATGPQLTIVPPVASAAANRRSQKLIDVEREHIRSVLDETGWRIRGAGHAADQLGLKPTTLETRMARLGLRRPGTPQR